MVTDVKRIADTLKAVNDTWSKIHPGKRVYGSDRDGNPCVFICDDLSTPVGRFESEVEARAFAEGPATVELLTEIVKKLVKERDEARHALSEIMVVSDPALDAFNEQKPVDMAAVLKVTHHWSHYVLGH